jgi:AraC-like DNA-binding protein
MSSKYLYIMNSKLYLLPFLLLIKILTAQTHLRQIPDSLARKSFDYLDEKIYKHKNDSTKASPYLYSYLLKAIKESNWKEVVYGYQNILHQSPAELRVQYADSMIYFAKKSEDQALIGSAFLSKGIVYYSQKKYNQAYNYYIKANEHISKSDDKYLIYKVKYNIAQIKYYLEFYDEAISLLKECIDYFRKHEPRPYLNSLHSLGVCYNKVGDYDLCSKTNLLGIEECDKLKIPEMKVFFEHSEGINQYFKNNFNTAITTLHDVLPRLNTNTEFANESIANFYIGKSYWKLNTPTKAIPYFQKVNQTFNEKTYIRPDLKEVFELLIKYYKKRHDLNSQLYYIDQLLKADSLLTDTNKYLIGKVHKEYDTKEIIIDRAKIRQQLIYERYYDVMFIGIILIMFLVIIYFTYKHFKNKRLNKLKFEELLKKIEEKKVPKPRLEKSDLLDVTPQAVETILKQLEKFEKGKKYLDKNLTLATLTVAFNSNSKYLSKVIYHHKDKGFVDYINDLKIDYLIDLLKNSSAYRNYTISVLADEAGFSTTPRFTNAFRSRTGISVSYFIKQLKKGKI